jgi:ABC-type uncharacterized transport system substrate-binding protein
MQFTVERKNIIRLAIERRLPVMMHSRQTAQDGALMSYAPSYELILNRTAIYVDKIIKGARPADLPVEQPRHCWQDRPSPKSANRDRCPAASTPTKPL